MDIILCIILIIICVLNSLLFIGAFVIFCVSIKSSSGKEMVFGKSRQRHKEEDTKKTSSSWLNQIQQVSIKSKDGYNLHGYELFKSPSAKWFICIHGYSGNATNMVLYMEHFIKLGYNILSVDLRGHGRSEGKYYGLGYLDQFDIGDWIDYITNKSKCKQVNLFGISMGGATVLMTAARFSEKVSKVITDSAPTDFVSMFTRILYDKIRFLTPFVINIVSLYSRLFAGYWLQDASAVNIVSKITVPTLFIHGQSDGFVPVSMVKQLYDRCDAPKKRLIIKNANHIGAVHENPKLYWETVEAFLEE